MSKFNKNKDQDNITTNNEGCVAYKIEDKLKLTTMVLTSLLMKINTMVTTLRNSLLLLIG